MMVQNQRSPAIPSPVEEAPALANQEEHIQAAPQTLAQDDLQGTSQTPPAYADVASTPPSPPQQTATPQPAAGDVIGAGSPPRQSTRASRPPKRYIEEH